MRINVNLSALDVVHDVNRC